MSFFSLPTREQELALHQRLLDDDATAPADVAGCYYDYLIRWLHHKNDRTVSEDLRAEAAGQALVDYIKRPHIYRSEKGKSLVGFLRMATQRDLQNLFKKEQRHRTVQLDLDSVEQLEVDGNAYSEAGDADILSMHHDKTAIAIAKVLPSVRDGLTDGELRALDLHLQGERKTATYATALGLEHLSAAERKTEVKRVKDKLKKRIERARREHDEST